MIIFYLFSKGVGKNRRVLLIKMPDLNMIKSKIFISLRRPCTNQNLYKYLILPTFNPLLLPKVGGNK